MIEPQLATLLERVGNRRRSLQLWRKLAVCWAAAGLLGLGLLVLRRQGSGGFPLASVLTAAIGLLAALVIALRHFRSQIDWREVALDIERRHPDLDGRLLTAMQQHARAGEPLNYLQQRLRREALEHGRQHNWSEVIPNARLSLARWAHWVALMFLALALWQLRAPSGHGFLGLSAGMEISVAPGDTSIERGKSLVVFARFKRGLPAKVDLVFGTSAASTKRIPLVKSLADPLFGGNVPEVSTNLLYHVEYSGRRTRDYTVTVFEHPRLERADADLVFPDYTREAPKHIADTRRLSAVEGSHLALSLQLNKPVATAKLVGKGKNPSVISLSVETNRPVAALKELLLDQTRTYELQLTDFEGRTNQAPAQFVIEVLTNRTPEMRLVSPKGDVRPSPLEEIAFEGTVWDDFGVEAYGLGYAQAGREVHWVELGRLVPAKEKRSFQYLLRLEELAVQPDELVSWFTWADDIGPDGQVRRTTGDLWFAEVRPFEEVFREAQGMDGGESGEAGSQQGQSSRLAEAQKQVIGATWKLQRDRGGLPGASVQPDNPPRLTPLPQPPASTGPKSRTVLPNTEAQRLSADRLQTHSLAQGRLFAAQVSGDSSLPPSTTSAEKVAAAPAQAPGGVTGDAAVVRDSQAQVLDQAREARERQQDPRAAALWEAALKQMETALARLDAANQAHGSLAEALAAEQAAYQALLRLQEHEYQVSRSRRQRGNASGNSREQQMQRQLQQMDLALSENRYEAPRQAQPGQTGQRREQLQVMNRLQELARRQQDLNERLKELQTALQEEQKERAREELQRRLKRLQEEEQQMLADVDELRQRMERPENQSSMAEQRKQLDQTREDVQRATEAAAQGAAAQALAAGTRAQRQLQQLRDELRKESSSQFAQDLREMRAEAREMFQQQEDILKTMENESNAQRKSLSQSPASKAVLDQLARQEQHLTNLVERAAEVSQQAENGEPLLSRQLADSVRQFTQDSAKGVKELQDQLLNSGHMSRDLSDRLKDSATPDGAKLLEFAAEMLRQDFLSQATDIGQRSRADMDKLKRGVERAAENVLGDDTEGLRLAQQELKDLTQQLQQEMAQGQVAQAQGERSSNSTGPNSSAAATPNGGEHGGNLARELDRAITESGLHYAGPLIGDDFLPWSDGLRDVEEMIEFPEWRNWVAGARERARLIRHQFKRERKKPDWAVVELQVMKPLLDAQDRIGEELAKRQSREALVPLDRDPVPGRYSELVRRYYEALGKDRR